ncbi:MAG: fused MFS/spermidine synthase [Patescibacteria group bacterium]
MLKITRAKFLSLVAFVVGAAVMAIEMTASRVLAPHFGASFFVWTALIVTVLLSMSVGYWVGGMFASRTPDNLEPLGLLLSSAAALLLASLWGSAGLGESAPALFELLGAASSALFVGALIMSFLLFSFPVFVLAMAGPVILKLWNAGSADVGNSSGKYFAVSTTGSVIGTLLPSLMLVPVFGVRVTFMLVAFLLAIFGLPLLRGRIRWLAASVILAAALMVMSQSATYDPTQVYTKESPYQLIRVHEVDGNSYLIFNEGSGTQSVNFPNDQRTHMYFDHFAATPLLAGEGSSLRTAVLGLAGGELVRQYLTVFPTEIPPDITGVEVDPDVIDVGRRFFATGDLPLTIVNEDGRTFLRGSEQEFDVIIVDAYSTQMYIPSHLVTAEFFSLAKSRLTDGGLITMNVNAPDRDSELLQAITNSIAAVFPHVYVSKAGHSWNWLITASERELDFFSAAKLLPSEYSDVAEALLSYEEVAYDSTIRLLTDDRAPIELMTDSMIIADAFKSR